ncbi:MAG: addiction module protein [Verrucomicrobiaceae bacterium]|nr:addiction module protein [Verrucomicrobiaceae bacterium]
MSTTVAHLLNEAMLLPHEARIDLVEAVLERSPPTDDFLTAQMKVVQTRMEKVKAGQSTLIPADEAHDSVLASLKLRA